MLETIKKRIQLKDKQVLLMMIDLFIMLVAGSCALMISCNFLYIAEYHYTFLCWYPLLGGTMLLIHFACGAYHSLWRYASLSEVLRLLLASILNFMALVMGLEYLDFYYPSAFPVVYCLLTLLMFCTVRFSYRIFRKAKSFRNVLFTRQMKKVMIVGAGKAGVLIAKELIEHKDEMKRAVVFLDDDLSKHHLSINGVEIKGSINQLTRISSQYDIDEIIIAIPSASRKRIAEIVEMAKDTGCKVGITPTFQEMLEGQLTLEQVRNVDIKDLLGRDEIQTDLSSISSYITGNTIMVTGGGGSIGSELCRQIAKYKPYQLVLIDNYENNAYDIQNELHVLYPELTLHTRIASVREEKRLEALFDEFRPEVVFHAAAHKHVPLMESSPAEAVKNNVFGTWNVAQMAHVFGAKRFVLISTDKAVNPTNVMGATKRLAERVVMAFNSISKTEFVAVRFGNVLGSNGSVVPLFKKQIEAGGPVTVTDPNIIRYFMTIPEAVQLVIQAGAFAKGGEVFVLDMGDPVKILKLAEDLIRLSGYRPYIDIKITFTGLRPGEKLYEELLMAEEGLIETQHSKIFIGRQAQESFQNLNSELKLLKRLASEDQSETMIKQLKKLVPMYKQPEIKSKLQNVIPEYNFIMKEKLLG